MAARFENVDPARALELVPKPRVIDVRQPEEFQGELGHIPNAELVPLATVAEKAREWRKDEPLLLVCRSGRRSSRAAELLAGMGFERVFNLEGGMLAVNAHNLLRER
jgi:rhodanese-related sulfurtransferase